MRPEPRQDISENKTAQSGKYLMFPVHSGQGVRCWILELYSLCPDIEITLSNIKVM